MKQGSVKIAILLPAHNEELTIAQMIGTFDKIIKNAEIVVIDNLSTDATRALAEIALNKLQNNTGVLLLENSKGKANAIRKAFRTIIADVYVMCDADSTYYIEDTHRLISCITHDGYEMAVADRHIMGEYAKNNSRRMHNFGNHLIQKIVNKLYSSELSDILSGFRAFSRNFVDSYPITISGFELETDLTLHALDKRLSIIEIPSGYQDRPLGSESKLNTISDGFRIIRLILRLVRYHRPFQFFGLISASHLLLALLLAYPSIRDYLQYRYVQHLPSALLAVGVAITGILMFLLGIILDAINNTNQQIFALSQVRKSK